MYLIAGTVEESIYDMSVARRLEHIKRNSQKVDKSKAGSSATSGAATPRLGENVIDQANSLELQEADIKKLLTSGKQGGEHVNKADLWQCLFGHKRVRESIVGGQIAAKDAPTGSEVGRFLRAEAAFGRAEAAMDDGGEGSSSSGVV
jgi:E3 ubiquitin-protein ligase SHPRH